MSKEVYSWRVSSELKADLEREARARDTSVSAVLDMAVRWWIKSKPAASADEDEQRRLHDALENCLGTFAGGNPGRAGMARESVRRRLRNRHGR